MEKVVNVRGPADVVHDPRLRQPDLPPAEGLELGVHKPQDPVQVEEGNEHERDENSRGQHCRDEGERVGGGDRRL